MPGQTIGANGGVVGGEPGIAVRVRACIAPVRSVSSSTPVSGWVAMKAGTVASLRVRPAGLKFKAWGARLMMAPWALGKNLALVTWAAVGPMTLKVPSGAICAGKGDGTVCGVAKEASSGAVPALSGSTKLACSGTQTSLQTSQVAAAVTLFPTFVAVNGRMTLPLST